MTLRTRTLRSGLLALWITGTTGPVSHAQYYYRELVLDSVERDLDDQAWDVYGRSSQVSRQERRLDAIEAGNRNKAAQLSRQNQANQQRAQQVQQQAQLAAQTRRLNQVNQMRLQEARRILNQEAARVKEAARQCDLAQKKIAAWKDQILAQYQAQRKKILKLQEPQAMTPTQKTWYETTLQREENYKKDLARVEAREHELAQIQAVNDAREQTADRLAQKYKELDARADAAALKHKTRRKRLDEEEARVRALEADVETLKARAKSR